MSRINRVIDLLSKDQPVYYTSTMDLTFENGKAMASTWADYIRVDSEHGPFDMQGLRTFMEGLKAGGPTADGYLTPPVIVELAMDGKDESTVRYNSWMIKQALGQGIHGLILPHAETPGAVRAYVEAARYPFAPPCIGLGEGLRGHGGHKVAAKIWDLTESEYHQRADVWPLNPNGELVLGIKIENRRALRQAEVSAAVPGIAFAEWGSGDMSLSFKYTSKPKPLPPELKAARMRVGEACKAAGIYFLTIATVEDVCAQIDTGVRIFRAYDPEVAKIGRAYTKHR